MFWTCDHLRSLSCFVVDFSFIFHMVTMCVVNALIKGEIEDQERPRPVDGRSSVTTD